MNNITRRLAVLTIALPVLAGIAAPAEAHRRWLLPSSTVLSGDREVISVDGAISNGLFIFDYFALPLSDLIVTGPDGKPVEPKIVGTAAKRTSFDVPLNQQGTYRIAVMAEGLMVTYKLNGENKRWRGREAELPAAVPAGATDVKIMQTVNRTETYATLGAPNDAALKPTGRGLELVPVTHPNNLVVGEPAQFKFLIDGKPAAGLKVEWVQGGTRYRNEAGDKTLTTDANGMVEVSVDVPGMYYLEAGQRDQNVTIPKADGRVVSYSAVFEFLPQ